MIKTIFVVTATAFWLVMMHALIQREYFQLSLVKAPHEVFALHNLKKREQYNAIYTGKDRIGFNFSVLEKLEPHESKEHAYELRHQTYLSFLFLGEEREMLVQGKALMDSAFQMQRFEFKIKSKEYWTKLSGQVVKDNLDLIIEAEKGTPVRKNFPLNGPVILSEALNFMWTPDNLKLGKQGRIRTWNPLVMTLEEIDFHVIRKETIPSGDQSAETYVIAVKQGAVETKLWVNQEGTVLKQESPMGFIIKKEENWEIFDAMRDKKNTKPDLPNLYSVPSNIVIETPEKLTRARLKTKIGDDETYFDLKRDTLKGTSDLTWPINVEGNDELARHLEETPFIQISDPSIVAKAKEIAGEEKTAIGAVLSLMTWVHQFVTPSPAMSLPNAREVLAIRKGDCNEFTVLFTALARSIGIPTKTVAGLVYQKGRFYYHAWAEVFVGRWIGIDPTFDQAPIDPLHIPLVEGDLKEQVDLITKIGRMNVFILETE